MTPATDSRPRSAPVPSPIPGSASGSMTTIWRSFGSWLLTDSSLSRYCRSTIARVASQWPAMYAP